MSQMQLPAHLMNTRWRVADNALSGLAGGAPPHISIKQNRFRLVDAGGVERLVESFHLDVVIVDANAHTSRSYYAEAYDPTATDYKPPTCFSDNGVAPSMQAITPQAATCAGCPNAVWGSSTSRVTGKDTKACQDAKKLAVLVPGLQPGMGFLLKVPPASLKNLRAYLGGLAQQVISGVRIDPSMVVTRLAFDQQVQGVLTFSAVGWVDPETNAFIEERGPNPYADLVGANDVPRQAALPAPVQAAPAIARARAPAPQVAPMAFAAAPAPAPAPQPAPMAFGAGFPKTAAPEPAQAPRTRGRPKKEDAPAPASTEAAPQFGMAPNPPAPDSGLSSAIAAVFNLPVG